MFSFNFVVGVPNNFSVIFTDANGIQTLLTPSQYTLFLNAPATGALWGVGGTLTYPTSGPPIASGTSLTFTRIVGLTQLVSISNQGDFSPTVIEKALDTLCLEIQQVSSRTGQFRGTWQTGIAYNYGDIVQDGAAGTNTLNYYTCVFANTSGTWATDLANGDWSLAFNTAAVIGYSNSAATSATNAATSATAAAASASTASTQAANASTSATSASTSATNASNSASSASSSATSSSMSASNASTSASSAAASASTATTQASTATTQASNASTSATSAATSATSAATSATAAAASATATAGTLYTTSTTNNTIGTGNFTFTVAAGKNFIAGQPIIAASNANGANYIHGYVNSYSGTTLIITETDNGGSGPHSDWNISVAGTQGPSGGGTGTVTTVSVVTANGLSGTVSNPTTTPALTLSFSGAATVGGTGQTTYATGDILYASATNTLSKLTVGSTGNVLTVAAGVPSWAAAASGSELVLLGTATASASSTLNFTSLMTSAYTQYMMVFDSLIASATSSLRLNASDNNGSSWDISFDAQIATLTLAASTAPTYASSANNAAPATLSPSLASQDYVGWMDITSSPGAGNFTFNCFLNDAFNLNKIYNTYGNLSGGSAVNALQLLPSAGNFTSGKVYFYGVKNT